jgi:hypothetical protein
MKLLMMLYAKDAVFKLLILTPGFATTVNPKKNPHAKCVGFFLQTTEGHYFATIAIANSIAMSKPLNTG